MRKEALAAVIVPWGLTKAGLRADYNVRKKKRGGRDKRKKKGLS